METFLLVEFIVFCIVFVVFLISLPFVIKSFAESNFIFTMVKEGTAKAIMGAGDSGFQRFVYQFKNKLDPATWEVTNEPMPASKYEKIINFFGLKGIYFLGWPGMHTVHSYRFRFNSLRQSPDDKTQEAGGIYYVAHDEEIDYVLLQEDVYYARIESAEDLERVPLNLDLTLRMRVTNPYKALFVAQEWLEMVLAIILPALRRYVATQRWEDLDKKRKDKEEEFWRLPEMISFKDQLKEDIGIDLINFYIIRISPAGKRAEMYEKAATRAFEAQQEAKAVLVLAKAEQERIAKIYGEIQKYKELGELIYRMESLVKASQGPGNTIIAAPEMASITGAISKILTGGCK